MSEVYMFYTIPDPTPAIGRDAQFIVSFRNPSATTKLKFFVENKNALLVGTIKEVTELK